MRALILTALVTFIAGAAALLIAAGSQAWIDANGFLHELFAYRAAGGETPPQAAPPHDQAEKRSPG